MPKPPEGEPRPNPVTAFDAAIAKRHMELIHLAEGFRRGFELIDDLSRVNQLLLASPRPDLVMTERVEIKRIDTLDDFGKLDNFVPSMRAFGMPLYEDEEDFWDPQKKERKFVGRKDFTEEERAQAFLLGARGDHTQHFAFAKANGMTHDFADDMLGQSHLNNEAFMRMWILLPELTEELMSACLNRPKGKDYTEIKEEIFIAYSLISRLVDKNDRGAIKDDGTVDIFLLDH